MCCIESIIYSENPKETYIPINKALVNGSIAAGMLLYNNYNRPVLK